MGSPTRQPRSARRLSVPVAASRVVQAARRAAAGADGRASRHARLDASLRPHFLLPQRRAGWAGGMAARGSCRAPTRRLLVLLLLPLLWAPVGVRAGPDEDLSHRNQEPPAPAQQLQPQPAAVQGLEPARAEVRAAAGGYGAGEPSEPAAGYQAPPLAAPPSFRGGWGRGAGPC